MAANIQRPMEHIQGREINDISVPTYKCLHSHSEIQARVNREGHARIPTNWPKLNVYCPLIPRPNALILVLSHGGRSYAGGRSLPPAQLLLCRSQAHHRHPQLPQVVQYSSATQDVRDAMQKGRR
ncbi:hypothetical protein EDD85DRAFT_939759 [Armillaria nabsnona]|nr:hypothetical protein EDD85DRAFT_939759 [Armillaria nabsnona]